MTRARVMAAPDALRLPIEETIRSGLSQKADETLLKADVREMREKLAVQFPAKSMWDLKFAPGGLVDIEFVAQFLQLKHAPAAQTVLDPNTVSALERFKRSGFLAHEEADALIDASRLQHALTQVLRIAVDGVLNPAHATQGLKALLSRAGGAEDFVALEQKLALAQASARAIFETQLTG
jgi:glutamate-ammonia-ligase adenylyltransferase